MCRWDLKHNSNYIHHITESENHEFNFLRPKVHRQTSKVQSVSDQLTHSVLSRP